MLLAVNAADNPLEVFDLVGGVPVHLASVPVGVGSVSVRARTNTETWVVHHISDTVSMDGSEVYVAIFDSGNRSTILGEGPPGLRLRR